jgi:uncharacterized protein (TIGR03435 family)
VGHGEFKHPVEDHPAASGSSAVEAEHELIQVEALQQQLGLKLETQKKLTMVLVVDHVEEKPTDN